MFKRILFLILSLVFSYKAFAENSCKLISRLDKDLWLVDSTGKIIQRLSYDGVYKTAATWSPDGKYIAYAPAPFSNFGEKAIFIIDNSGQELSKIIVEPKTDDPNLQYIRWVSKLNWEKTNILWSDSAVGKNGGFIDIWKLDSNLRASREKRIGALGGSCELSPSEQYVVCIYEILKNEKFLPILMLYDTSKKRFQEDEFFSDDNPRTIELKQIEHVDKIRFTSDNANVIIIGADKKYKFNMLDNKLSEIKELPPDVKVKSIPKMVKIKKDEKELSVEVFDMYCGQNSTVPK